MIIDDAAEPEEKKPNITESQRELLVFQMFDLH